MNRRNFLKLAGSSLVRSVIPVKANPEPPLDLVKEIEKLTANVAMHKTQSISLWESWLREIGRANKFEAEAEYWYDIYQENIAFSQKLCDDSMNVAHEYVKLVDIILQTGITYPALKILKPGDKMHWGYTERNRADDIPVTILQPNTPDVWWIAARANDTYKHRSIFILENDVIDEYVKDAEVHIYCTDIFYPDWSTFLMLQERLNASNFL